MSRIAQISLVLLMSIKLFILYWEDSAKFSQQVHVESSSSLTDFEVLSQVNYYQFKFRPQSTQQITVNIPPRYGLNLYVDGVKTNYQDKKSQISFEVPKREWGRSNVVIRNESPLEIWIDLLIAISVIAMIFSVSNQKQKNAVAVLLLSFSVVYISVYISLHFGKIFEKTNINKYADLYQRSQYVMGQGADEIVEDEVVYTLAGYHYAVDGADPTSIDFEHPPLAKYMYGYAIRLFDRAHLASMGTYILLVGIFFIVSRLVLRDQLLYASAVALFAVEKETLSLMRSATLDLPLTLFLLSTYLFYLLLEKKKNFALILLMGVGLGFSMAAKIYFTAIIFFLIIVLDMLLNNKKILKYSIPIILVAVAIYTLTYAAFLKDHSFSEFINFQKWMLSWFKGKPDTKGIGAIFSTLFIGRIKAWWDFETGNIIRITNWSPFWSLYGASTMIGALKFLRTKKYHIIYIWPVVYLLFLSLGASGPNLLVVLFPFFVLNYVLLVSIISKHFSNNP